MDEPRLDFTTIGAEGSTRPIIRGFVLNFNGSLVYRLTVLGLEPDNTLAQALNYMLIISHLNSE